MKFNTKKFRDESEYESYYDEILKKPASLSMKVGLCDGCGNELKYKIIQPPHPRWDEKKKEGLLPSVESEGERNPENVMNRKFYCRTCQQNKNFPKRFECAACGRPSEFPHTEDDKFPGGVKFYAPYLIGGAEVCCSCYAEHVTPQEYRRHTWENVEKSFCKRDLVQKLKVYNFTKPTFYISGTNGVGKTTLCYLLQRKVMSDPYVLINPTRKPKYVFSLNELLASIYHAPFESTEVPTKTVLTDLYKTMDLLILDDFVIPKFEDRKTLFTIIDYREQNKLPTFFASNTRIKTIETEDRRISDRILGFVGENIYWCEGPSFRAASAQEDPNAEIKKQLMNVKDSSYI